MIRINLLPSAKGRQAGPTTSGSQGWIIGYLVAAALTAVVLALVYVSKNRELNEQLAQNRDLLSDIEELESESANIDQVRAELDQSRQLEQVVDELQRARYGPTAVLMEMSRILSVNGGPTVDPQALEERRQRDPTARVNMSWDPHRLWLTEFVETGRDTVIRGFGKTNEDVAEFLRRLILSERFERVALVKTQGAVDAPTQLAVIFFELTGRVIY